MYLVWKSDFENEPVHTRATVLNIKALAGINLTGGHPLLGQLPVITLEIVSDYPPADYFNAGPLFVVSERLRKLFEVVGVPVEYHPVVLHNKTQEKIFAKYFFANIIDKVDCFDFENSVYTMDGEFIDKIQKLEIDESKTAGRALFRLARSFDVITFASQKLQDAVFEAEITGVKFVTPSDWNW